MKIYEKIDSLLGEQLVEARVEDLRGKVFAEFLKEWKQKRRAGETKGMYVNFTNFSGDKLVRTASPNPNHHDPMGVYGYPIDYVLDHPADVRYGARAKYLRVLKDTSSSKVRLQNLRKSKAARLLEKAGFDHGVGWLHAAEARFSRIKQPSKWAKAFFSVIQMDFDRRDPTSEGSIRSGKEQTRLLRKMDVDAIEDDARDINAAVINDREPEQIIFLSRKAFRVEQTYTLRGDEEQRLITSEPIDKDLRKLAAMTAEAMGDRLSDGGKSHKISKHRIPRAETYSNVYWTQKGRQIAIKTHKDPKFFEKMKNELKFGQKPHRWFKSFGPYVFDLDVSTEFGDFRYVSSPSKSFQEIASEIGQRFERKKASGLRDDWEPLDKDSAVKAAKEAEEARRKTKRDKELQKFEKKEWPDFVESLKSAASQLGEPIILPDDPEKKAELYRMLKSFSRDFWSATQTKNPDREKLFDEQWEFNQELFDFFNISDEAEALKPIIRPALTRGGAEGFGFPFNIKNAEL